MRAIVFAILYLGLLLEHYVAPNGGFKNVLGALAGMSFCLAVLFAILGW